VLSVSYFMLVALLIAIYYKQSVAENENEGEGTQRH